MANITKHGDSFYVIEPLHCAGHKNKDGQMLAGQSSLVFAFRRPGDLPHINVDPVDVLSVLAEHLKDTAAGDLILDAARTLADGNSAAAPAERSEGVTPSGGKPRPSRKQPQPAVAA